MKVRGLLIVNLLLAAAMAGFGWWVAAGLAPGTQLPVHWNASGEPDGFQPALPALLWPAGLSMVAGLIMAAIPRLEPMQDRLEASAPVLRAAWIGVMGLMIYVQAMIAAPVLGWNIGVDLLLAGLGVMFLMIGNALPKSRPGFLVGIRTPWTLTDTDNWIATHRLGGKLMMGAGVVMILAALLPIAPQWRLAAMIAPVMGASVVPVAYSWWLSRALMPPALIPPALIQRRPAMIRTALLAAAALLVAPLAAPLQAESAPAGEPIEAPGPLARASEGGEGPVALIIPGSGPTDRDGNNPLGVAASPYRLLAEALLARGIATVRIDKRGMFASGKAVADGNAVTIPDYVADTAAWVAATKRATGAPCVWLIGHSEGGLVALAAAQELEGLCGVVLVAAPGRPLGDVIKAQIRANPANFVIVPAAEAAIDELVAGRRVDPATLPAPLQGLFAPSLQGALTSLFSYDPAALAAKVKLPLLIVQGGRDLQVAVADAERMAGANPAAKLVVLPDLTHVLKDVADASPAANLATYRDPALPLGKGVAEAVADFIAP